MFSSLKTGCDASCEFGRWERWGRGLALVLPRERLLGAWEQRPQWSRCRSRENQMISSGQKEMQRSQSKVLCASFSTSYEAHPTLFWINISVCSKSCKHHFNLLTLDTAETSGDVVAVGSVGRYRSLSPFWPYLKTDWCHLCLSPTFLAPLTFPILLPRTGMHLLVNGSIPLGEGLLWDSDESCHCLCWMFHLSWI